MRRASRSRSRAQIPNFRDASLFGRASPLNLKRISQGARRRFVRVKRSHDTGRGCLRARDCVCPARPARRAPSRNSFSSFNRIACLPAVPVVSDIFQPCRVLVGMPRLKRLGVLFVIPLPCSALPCGSPAALCLPSFPFACGKCPASSREGSALRFFTTRRRLRKEPSQPLSIRALYGGLRMILGARKALPAFPKRKRARFSRAPLHCFFVLSTPSNATQGATWLPAVPSRRTRVENNRYPLESVLSS